MLLLTGGNLGTNVLTKPAGISVGVIHFGVDVWRVTANGW